MKKIGTLYKEASERELRERLSQAASMFIVGYSGLTSNVLNELRNNLTQAGARLFVSKNSMAKRVLEQREVGRFIEGPIGFVFAPTDTDPISVSKILKKFSKENEKLILRGAILQDRVLESKDIDMLASLPSKEMLYTMLVTGLKAPISNTVSALKQLLNKLVVALSRIKEKKENDSTGGK